jgi:enoyl-CoA hydratase/carnithine racemase
MDYADFQFLTFEHRDNGVLVITINRPEVMNATNARLHWELTKIWGVVQGRRPHQGGHHHRRRRPCLLGRR